MEQCRSELEYDLERLGELKRKAATLLEELRQTERAGESRECCIRREKWFIARLAVHSFNKHIEQYIQFRLPPMPGHHEGWLRGGLAARR
ncbi:hypothetical protein [Pollutimonas bauzanensis]|uniref:Uncharacterized protein n=1 Tax=Pollutimonas bauzanensis TaxID=658167 RepID=A0A1M5W3E9_9BURK|nr:hypothetical protein [Pollutimonas bauzanensis]SHH82032.1 hypothetical protein SAMN04488135_10573 [Pollutimonas bauzanensis]